MLRSEEEAQQGKLEPRLLSCSGQNGDKPEAEAEAEAEAEGGILLIDPGSQEGVDE
jgi:hypothetical protein